MQLHVCFSKQFLYLKVLYVAQFVYVHVQQAKCSCVCVCGWFIWKLFVFMI